MLVTKMDLVEVGSKRFLHSSKWTERIIAKFEKYIHLNPDECRHIAGLALSSGVSKLWAQDHDNHFSFMAWLLTTDNYSHEINEKFSRKVSVVLDNANVSQALKASLHVASQMRNCFSKHKKYDSFVCWSKETINRYVAFHNVNYINLQGIDLTNSDLSGLKLPANLRKTNLTGADISNTDLRGAYLREVLVSDEQLAYAIVDDTTELPR
jgi:hypothetical protein